MNFLVVAAAVASNASPSRAASRDRSKRSARGEREGGFGTFARRVSRGPLLLRAEEDSSSPIDVDEKSRRVVARNARHLVA